jgi:hypothetical protein
MSEDSGYAALFFWRPREGAVLADLLEPLKKVFEEERLLFTAS